MVVNLQKTPHSPAEPLSSALSPGSSAEILRKKSNDFAAAVAKRWTADAVRKLIGKKKLLLAPNTHAELLFQMGLMHADASITPDQVKKFLQVNHMTTLLWAHVLELRKMMPQQQIVLVDVGCGNSYLGMAFAFLWKESFGTDGLLICGVDVNPKVLQTSSMRAAALGLEDILNFFCGSIGGAAGLVAIEGQKKTDLPERIHGVLALHACDKATDAALAFGLEKKADWMAVVPCCQAELAQILAEQSQTNEKSPLAVLINSPQLRRESAATLTDGLRIALVRALGYEVTATEFVPSNHTPKNRLINCQRRGNYHIQSYSEFLALKALLGIKSLELEARVLPLIQAQPL